MCEAGQGVGAVTAVAREDELAVGEPVDQDSQHLLHQFRGRLVPPPLPAVSSSGRYQGHRIKMGVFHKIGKSRHSD